MEGTPWSYNAAIDAELIDPLSGSNALRAYLCEVERMVGNLASVEQEHMLAGLR